MHHVSRTRQNISAQGQVLSNIVQSVLVHGLDLQVRHQNTEIHVIEAALFCVS